MSSKAKPSPPGPVCGFYFSGVLATLPRFNVLVAKPYPLIFLLRFFIVFRQDLSPYFALAAFAKAYNPFFMMPVADQPVSLHIFFVRSSLNSVDAETRADF